jgi:hypothetical protein
MQLFAKNASSIPKLSEIRDEVEKHYIKAESQILCRKEADDVLDRLKKGAAMTEVAREKNLSTDHTGFFTPGTAIPKIGPSHDIGMAIYQLSENNPLAEQPFLVDNQYFIIGFKDRILEEKDFETNKDSLRQFLTQVKENLYFQSWIEASREAMKATGKIKISEDVDKL